MGRVFAELKDIKYANIRFCPPNMKSILFRETSERIEATWLGEWYLASIRYREAFKRWRGNDPTYKRFLPLWVRKKWFNESILIRDL